MTAVPISSHTSHTLHFSERWYRVGIFYNPLRNTGFPFQSYENIKKRDYSQIVSKRKLETALLHYSNLYGPSKCVVKIIY